MDTLAEYIFRPALSYLFIPFLAAGPIPLIHYILFIPRIMRATRKKFHNFKFRVVLQVLLGLVFLSFAFLAEFPMAASLSLETLFRNWILILTFSLLLLKTKEGSKLETFQIALVSFFAVTVLNLIIGVVFINVFDIWLTV